MNKLLAVALVGETCQQGYMKQHGARDCQPEDRDGFRFRGGSVALDLTATLQARRGPAPRELLATPQDLDRWLVAAGLAATSPGASGEDLATARALREAIFELAGQLAAPSLGEQARETLNEIAANPAAAPRLLAGGKAELTGSAARLLATLAREAIGLLGGELAGKVSQCQSETCSIYFVDTSRSGDRRWCSMSACGNKAKVAEYRRRRRNPAQT